MNTILVTGTVKRATNYPANNTFIYDLTIWASREGQQIRYITSGTHELRGHSEVWAMAKDTVIKHLGNDCNFDDGAYTTFLDSIKRI